MTIPGLPSRTPTAEDLHLTRPSAYTWPVTWHYEMLAPWGLSSLDLTADIPLLANMPEAAKRFGVSLWSTAIAPAISKDVELAVVWTANWKVDTVPEPVPIMGVRGLFPGAPTERDHAGQIVALTGHYDALGRRRLLLPGIPARWVRGGLLQPEAMERLQETARGMYMGLRPLFPNSRCRWLIAYVDAIDPELDNPYGVCFRDVTSVRVCHHTDRAPDLPQGLWPR